MPVRILLTDFPGNSVNQPFGLLVDGNFACNIGSLFLRAGSDSCSGIASSLNLPSTLRVRSYMLILPHYATPLPKSTISFLVFSYHLSL